MTLPRIDSEMRIVSLLPSATESICLLGLGDQLVGVTHECDFPPHVRHLPKVTRTLIPHDASSQEIDSLVRERLASQPALYSLDLPTLEQLRPNLIVTQALCDVCAVAEAEVVAATRRLPGPPRIVNLEPMRLADVFDDLIRLGEAAGVPAQAQEAVGRLRTRVATISQRSRRVVDPPGVALLEWLDPLFCAGHWSPELVRLAGGAERVGREGRPSRRVAWEELFDADPEVLVIACCGQNVARIAHDLPRLAARRGFADLACVRFRRVFLIDGSAYFNRPGPRLVDSLEILAHALHPQLHPLPRGLPAARPWHPRPLDMAHPG